MQNEDHALREGARSLVDAVQSVLLWRVGELPDKGFIHDNDPSRTAIGEMAAALVQARAALSATPTPAPQDETAWLIEMIHNYAPVPRYWNPSKNKGWIWDASDAIRFNREQDARDYLDGFQSPLGGKPVEHMWMAPAPANQHRPQVLAPPVCPYCDGTGDVHRADGEWLGECDCGAEDYKDASPCRKEHLPTCPASPTPAPIDNEAFVDALEMCAYQLEEIAAPHMRDYVPGALAIQCEIKAKKARAVLALPSIAERDALLSHWMIECELAQKRVAATSALVEEAIGALELAANRLGRCSIEPVIGSRKYYEWGEWAQDARKSLAKLKEGRA